MMRTVLFLEDGCTAALGPSPDGADYERHVFLRSGRDEAAIWGTYSQRMALLRQWAQVEGCVLIEDPANVPVAALAQVASREDVARVAEGVA